MTGVFFQITRLPAPPARYLMDFPEPPAEPWLEPPKQRIETISDEEHAALDGANLDMEGLLNAIKEADDDWKLNDKIDLAVRVEEERKKRSRKP